MAELESMKYFTPEMLGESPETSTALPEGGSPIPPRDPEKLATAADLGIAEWTMGLTIVVWMFTIFGGWAILGSIVSMISLATLESTLAYYQKLGSIGDTQYHVALTEYKIENCLWLYLVEFTRFGLGVVFLAAAAVLKSKKEDANRFAAMACIGGVFYGLVSMMVAFMMLPDASIVPGVDSEVVDAINLLSTGFLVAGFFVNMVFYGGLMAFLLNKNNRRLFGKRVPAAGEATSPAQAGQLT